MSFVFLSTRKEENNSHVPVSHDFNIELGAASLSNDVGETELSDGSENLADGSEDEELNKGDEELENGANIVSFSEEIEENVAVQGEFGNEQGRSVQNSEELDVAPAEELEEPSSNDSVSYSSSSEGKNGN